MTKHTLWRARLEDETGRLVTVHLHAPDPQTACERLERVTGCELVTLETTRKRKRA